MSTILPFVKGDTFIMAARWEQPVFSYAPITTITQAAPASITATAHGVPNGWRVAVQSAKGMTDINAADLKDKSFVKATVIDVDTIELNTINSLGFKPHTTGSGVVVFRTPVDLTGYSARMQVRDKIGGTLLISSSTYLGGGDLSFDDTAVGTRTVTGTGTNFVSTDVGRRITLDSGKFVTIISWASETSVTVMNDAILSTTSFAENTWSFVAEITLTVDTAQNVVGIEVEATVTAGLSWKKGYYDLEMVSGLGKVSKLLSGTVTVTDEVTTD